jgi:hypothetical protein
MKRRIPSALTDTPENLIFVFGSNKAGRHGRGAAYYAAKYYGAKYGVGEGRTGNAYAIPTKDENFNPIPLDGIRKSLRKFIKYAVSNPDLVFMLTPIGTGLAGYRIAEIASLLHDIAKTGKGNKSYKHKKDALPIPSNVLLSKEWFQL